MEHELIDPLGVKDPLIGELLWRALRILQCLLAPSQLLAQSLNAILLLHDNINFISKLVAQLSNLIHVDILLFEQFLGLDLCKISLLLGPSQLFLQNAKCLF